jgi:hypothetical protein
VRGSIRTKSGILRTAGPRAAGGPQLLWPEMTEEVPPTSSSSFTEHERFLFDLKCAWIPPSLARFPPKLRLLNIEAHVVRTYGRARPRTCSRPVAAALAVLSRYARRIGVRTHARRSISSTRAHSRRQYTHSVRRCAHTSACGLRPRQAGPFVQPRAWGTAGSLTPHTSLTGSRTESCDPVAPHPLQTCLAPGVTRQRTVAAAATRWWMTRWPRSRSLGVDAVESFGRCLVYLV